MVAYASHMMGHLVSWVNTPSSCSTLGCRQCSVTPDVLHVAYFHNGCQRLHGVNTNLESELGDAYIVWNTWKSAFVVPVCLIPVWEPAGCHGVWGMALAIHSYPAPFLFMRKHALLVVAPAFPLDCGIFCLRYFCVNPVGVAVPFTCSLSTSFQVH